MKKILSLVFTVFLVSCYTEDPYVDTSIMPEETQYGAGTFGCLIDGWIYAGGRYAYSGYNTYHNGLEFVFDEEYNILHVDVIVNMKKKITFSIVNPTEGEACLATDVTFDRLSFDDMTVSITRLDTKMQIISGRFENDYIKEGRFDVSYITAEQYDKNPF